MIVAFTGGRGYHDRNRVAHVFGALGVNKSYVGDATGLDALVRAVSLSLNVPCEVFAADWDKHGRAAGPIRNAAMLTAAHLAGARLLVAFPGGKGTLDAITRAEKMNMLVLRIHE